jgi:hypothetical protein
VSEDQDRGSALVELIGATVLLLIPLVYLVLTLGRVQAGAFAADGGAHAAARAAVATATTNDAVGRARVAVALALEDQGFDPAPALAGDGVTVACSASPCLTPGAAIDVTVRVEVPLPFVPPFFRSWVPLAIPVESHYRATVDAFGELL